MTNFSSQNIPFHSVDFDAPLLSLSSHPNSLSTVLHPFLRSPSLGGDSPFPISIIKSQLTQRQEAISAIKGAAETRNQENRRLRKRTLCPAYIQATWKSPELESPCLFV